MGVVYVVLQFVFAVLYYLLFVPYVAGLFVSIVLAALGKNIGIRRLYIAVLLKLFDFVHSRVSDPASLCEEEEEEEDTGPEEEDDTSPAVFSRHGSGKNTVIKRDFYLTVTRGLIRPGWEPSKKQFEVADTCYFTKCGMEAIIEDDVTQRFKAGELTSWNLLSRTNKGYKFESVRLKVLWGFGFLLRYFILFPFRFVLAVTSLCWLVLSTPFIGYIPPGRFKRRIHTFMSLMTFRMFTRGFGATLTFHNVENRAKNGISVSNHTTPIDAFILSSDNTYALSAQVQGGVFGVVQRALKRAFSHVFFERSEMRDRKLLAEIMREHASNPDKPPMLMFPEGTCINNTSVMMFKKGSFEVSTTVHPVAIKYDLRFSDAYWDSSTHNMLRYLFNVMTSWGLVCDVWYMPPMDRKENEVAVEFARRVQREIARQCGLVDLDWDGQLKRMRVKDTWKQKPQEQFSSMLKVD